MFMLIILILLAIIIYFFIVNYLSYNIIKNKVLKSQKWGLNICCGKTDGGGINADIVKHKNMPRFKLVKNIYTLPFKNNQFKEVLCSHTIEHIENPKKFYKELKRVGKDITLLVPPLWDVSAAFNIFEHKWLFLTLKTKYVNKIPKHIKLPLSKFVQKNIGQKIKA